MIADVVERNAAPSVASPREEAAVAARVADVRDRIRAAAAAAGRPDDVTLVAVSKLMPADLAADAVRAGVTDLGESRAQELTAKAEALDGLPVTWHFVGRLQRNKVRAVVGTVALLHSVDRLPLAEAVAAEAQRRGVRQNVLVQVNAGDDPNKAGVAVDEAEQLVAAVAADPNLSCDGLMTIPPLDADPATVFARLRELRDDLARRYPSVRHLSMGMSNDFEVAVANGATIVRVGEAVFGPRPGSVRPAAATARRAR